MVAWWMPDNDAAMPASEHDDRDRPDRPAALDPFGDRGDVVLRVPNSHGKTLGENTKK